MTISATTTLSKPSNDAKIGTPTFSYMRARLRQRVHSMILKEFAESGLTKAELARRLGQDPALVNRWLSEPKNLRLSTLSDIVFAISGGEPAALVEHPLKAPPSNLTRPSWLATALDNRKHGSNVELESSKRLTSNAAETTSAGARYRSIEASL